MTDKIQQILVDSDVWVGYYLSDDAHHEKVVTTFEQLENDNFIPIISSQIIGEVATVLSHKSGASLARKFVDDVETTGITTIYLNKKIHNRAIDIFVAEDKKGISYGDCVNVATLEEIGLGYIYAYDKFYHKRFEIQNIAYPEGKVA